MFNDIGNEQKWSRRYLPIALDSIKNINVEDEVENTENETVIPQNVPPEKAGTSLLSIFLYILIALVVIVCLLFAFKIFYTKYYNQRF